MPPKKVVNKKVLSKPANFSKKPIPQSKKIVNEKSEPNTIKKSNVKSEPNTVQKSNEKVWTEKDDKAVIIQKYIRMFLAKRKLANMKLEKENYEKTMEELEQKAYLSMVKRDQEEAERQRKKEAEEKRRIMEFNKRRKDMLEAAFDGNLSMIISILKQVEESDNKMGISRDLIGVNLRKRHLLEMINCEDANKNTPVSEAASGGHGEIIQFLIDKGADVNCRGQFKRTPLYRASFAGNLDAVEVLLRNGADPKLYADDAQTPFDVAAIDAVKEFISNWDYSDTEKLLKKIEQNREKLAAENRKRIEAELDNIDNQITKAERDFEAGQKRLNKAYCELEKRIHEHDVAVGKGFEKIDITVNLIHDAEFEVESAKIQFEKNREVLSLLKLKKREKQKEEGLANGVEEVKPGIECNIRELDDVLFRDVGNRIEQSGKWPMVIDPSGQASIFLRYRDTNYVNALNMGQMEHTKLRLALLGSLRYGKPMVVDIMEIIEAFQSFQDRLNELASNLTKDVISKAIIQPEKYKRLLKPGDDAEYDKNKFSESRTKNFRFILLTNNSLPTTDFFEWFHPIWVHI